MICVIEGFFKNIEIIDKLILENFACQISYTGMRQKILLNLVAVSLFHLITQSYFYYDSIVIRRTKNALLAIHVIVSFIVTKMFMLKYYFMVQLHYFYVETLANCLRSMIDHQSDKSMEDKHQEKLYANYDITASLSSTLVVIKSRQWMFCSDFYTELCNKFNLDIKSFLSINCNVDNRTKSRWTVRVNFVEAHGILLRTFLFSTMFEQRENLFVKKENVKELFSLSFQLRKIPSILHEITGNSIPSPQLSSLVKEFSIQLLNRRIRFSPYRLFEMNMQNIVPVRIDKWAKNAIKS